MTDDGFNIGILYRGDRPVFHPGKGGKAAAVETLGEEFRV